MNQVQTRNRKYLILATLCAVSSYLYRAISASNYGDLSFLNPAKHHMPDGSMIFMGAPVTWVLGSLGLLFLGVYMKKGGSLP